MKTFKLDSKNVPPSCCHNWGSKPVKVNLLIIIILGNPPQWWPLEGSCGDSEGLNQAWSYSGSPLAFWYEECMDQSCCLYRPTVGISTVVNCTQYITIKIHENVHKSSMSQPWTINIHILEHNAFHSICPP